MEGILGIAETAIRPGVIVFVVGNLLVPGVRAALKEAP